MAGDSMAGAIKRVMDKVKNELVITSVGTISREVFACCDRPGNLYLMGAMGCALGVGIGLALNTEKKVVVIAGDGDILMSLGTLVLMEKLGLKNLELHIMDNGVYAATGCQSTCSAWMDFNDIIHPTACVVWSIEPRKTDAPRITLSPIEIQERFYAAVNGK